MVSKFLTSSLLHGATQDNLTWKRICSCEAVHWICREVSPRDVCRTFVGTTAGCEVGVAETDVAATEGNMFVELMEGFVIELLGEGLMVAVLGMSPKRYYNIR